MRRLIPALVALLVLVPVCRAGAPPDDKDKAAKPATPAEQVKALTQEYNKRYNEFLHVYRTAKTNEERRKAIQEKLPKVREYTRKLLKIAEEHPKTPAAVDALVWVAVKTPYAPDGTEAQNILLKDHIKSPKLTRFVAMIPSSRIPDKVKTLKRIIEENPHNQVKGQATFALGQLYMNQKKEKAAEKAFEDVVKNYGALPGGRGSLGAMARTNLFEIRHLSVGKVAPNIVGTDEDGKKFQLSDYRGKVVLLDFWGEW
jgi:hypothetical protein